MAIDVRPGPTQKTRCIAQPKQDVAFTVNGASFTVPRPAHKAAMRNEEAMAPGNNHVYFCTRIPHPFDPKGMPYSTRLLQRVRDGLGPEEQGHLVAPTGFYNEEALPKFGFQPRRRYNDMVGTVGPDEAQTGERRNQNGGRSAVNELRALLAPIARGFKDVAFAFVPPSRLGARDDRARTGTGKARDSVQGGDLQPPAPTLSADDIAVPAAASAQQPGPDPSSRSGRRSSSRGEGRPSLSQPNGGAVAPSYEVPAVFCDNKGNSQMPKFAASSVAKVHYGPADPGEQAEEAEEQIALLNETIFQIAKDAPEVSETRKTLAEIELRRRRKAILQAGAPLPPARLIALLLFCYV
eukprot:SAG22_NODE_1529_length_4218_cov_2.153435_8_plen_352_part_00